MLSRFRTKKSKLEYVRDIIYRLDCGYVRYGDEYYSVFLELVGDKYSDIAYFSIVPNRRNFKSLETQCHLNDGSIHCFSWNKAINGNVDSEHKKIRDMMRSAIVPDILLFKRDAICCCYCGSTEYLQADHIDPFRDLAKQFIDIHGVVGDWIVDWVKFHKDNARLQILCSGCNYKKH